MKRFQKPKGERKSPFANLDSPNCTYTYSEIYLGAEATVYLYDRKTEFHFSFSVKDGILVKIKSNHPDRILFDYVDGSYYTNDDSNIDYNRLIGSLSTLAQNMSTRHHSETYAELEGIMYDFITNSCDKGDYHNHTK